jgi:hypothetical protein
VILFLMLKTLEPPLDHIKNHKEKITENRIVRTTEREIFLKHAWILYIYISMTQYKPLILILLTCKYTILSHVMSYFFIEKYFWKFNEHATSPYTMSSFMPHHLMSCHFSPLKNISENSMSMPHHHMLCHLSLLKK